MNLIYHHRTQGRGAEGVHVDGLVKAFRQLGHEVRVLCPPGVSATRHVPPQSIPHGKISRGRGLSETWRRVSGSAPESIFEFFELLYNFYSYFSLAAAIRERRPDFIYDRYALFHVAPAMIARTHGIPLVTEINDATFIQRTRGLSFKRLARYLEGIVLAESTLNVTVSRRFRELIHETHGRDVSYVAVTPNAVDPERFQPRDSGEERARLGLEGCSVLGVVGGFVPWHGLDHLVESVQDLVRGRDDRKVLLVGDGPVRADIERLVTRLDLAGRVEFTGFVSAADVPRYIDCMDVCLMPDSNEHGSPIKIFEYMAMGKAVAAPRYGPIEEVIRDGVNGYLFRPRDREDLRRVVQMLLEDREARREAGERARQTVLQRHTWRANAEKVLALLAPTRGPGAVTRP